MAKGYWWQKIPNPDAIVKAARRPVSDSRIRYTTTLQRAGLFRDEPDIVNAFTRADVPLALAMRTFNAMYAEKQRSIATSLAGAGYTDKSLEPNVARDKDQGGLAGSGGDKPEERKQAHSFGIPDEGGGLFGWLGRRVDDVANAFTDAAEGVAEGATWVYNRTLGAPLAAGYGTETSFDRDLQQAMNDNSDIPVVGPVGNFLAGLTGGIVNWGEGVYRLASGDVSGEQRQDIARGGGDAGSFSDRVSFYANDFGEKRAPVNDADMRWLKGLGKYDPVDVDAAREIVTMGALEDLARSFPSLSPAAQDLILKATKDKKAEELLKAVGDTSQNTLGGRLVRAAAPNAEPGEWLGPATVSRGVAAGISELIATWYLDPVVVGAKGYQAVRNVRYAVNLAKPDALDRTVRMLAASDDAFKPDGALATRFDAAMDTVEQIHQAGDDLVQAAKLRQSWIRRFPGYDKTLDILLGMRTGSIGRIRVRSEDEAVKDADSAIKVGRGTQPWILETAGDGTPFWRFVQEDGTKLTDKERAVERARVADELGTFILLDAFASGRELTGSRLLLPGQVSINGKIRDKITPVLEAFTRRDRSVMRQLDETGTKPVDLNGHLSAGENGTWETLVSPEAADWYRNNYTFGPTHFAARAWRSLERTFSNKFPVPTSPDSVKIYGQLVSQFMPKRQAQMLTTVYAASNPAERWVMTRQTIGTLLNVMNLRNTPEAQMIVERLTKGLVPAEHAIEGYHAGKREWYTTPDDNFIRVGDLKMPAAVHPWQLADGFELPNWRELRGLANRGWFLRTVTRYSNGPMANALVHAWKASKTTTWANLFRQGAELGMFTAWRDPKVLPQYRKARKAVKADILQRKVNSHDMERLANEVNNLDASDLDKLERIRRSDPEAYISTVATMLERNGFNRGAAELLARLGSDVDLEEFAAAHASQSERRVRHLAMVGPWDALRKTRAERARRKGGSITDSPLDEYLDGQMAADMVSAHAKEIGNAADSHVWQTAERSTHVDRARITDAAAQGIAYRPVKIENGYKWLGSKAEVTPVLWSAELGRRMSDPIGQLVVRLIAHRYLVGKAEDARPKMRGEWAIDIDDLAAERLASRLFLEKVGPATAEHQKVIDLADEIDKLVAMQARGKPGSKAYVDRQRQLDALGPKPTPAELQSAKDEIQRISNEIGADPLVDPARLRGPDDLVAYLYGEHPLGASMRNNGARIQYLPDGTAATNAGDRLIAAQEGARSAVNDLVHYMGGTVIRHTVDKGPVGGRLEIKFHEDADEILAKLASGESVSVDDLARLTREAYPEGMAAPLHAPMIPAKFSLSQGISNLATRAYGAVVADPLDKLFALPVFIAHRRIAYGEVVPLMEQLVQRGLPEGQAAYLLESAVNNRAINRLFLTTDRPSERSAFSEMGDKWLMFQRAQEDFLRRFISATKASPQGLVRANILMQAGVHAGIIHYEPSQDENGNTEYHLTFSYPGTDVAQRVLADAAAGLGLAPDEILRVPQFDGLKSQVRFINPGISNPIQFSANPIFGMSVWMAEKIWPSATMDLERVKQVFSPGQDFEGTDGPFSLKNLMPSMFTRFVPLMQKGDADGQFQSAVRAALMYSEAAGLTPPADASPAERERYLDAVKATATNILIQRAVFGTFLPASPQIADPDDIELDTLARLESLPNLRSEFFDLRSEFSKKYPDNFFRADSEAVAEFARRYPGELIVNPSAFSTSSTKVAGTDKGYAPYTIPATRWLFDNIEFVRANPMIAMALMPKDLADGDYSNEAYKIQFKSDIRTHKDLEEFYTAVTLSDDIDEFYRTVKTYSAAAKAQPELANAIYAKMDEWEDGWRRVHPLADQEIDRRSNPQFVHAEVVPALDRIVKGVDQLPASLAGHREQVEQMLKDYRVYRATYEKVSFYNNAGRSDLNKQYRARGDLKWINTPMAGLWDLMRVSEGF